jgi:hypothetical protein
LGPGDAVRGAGRQHPAGHDSRPRRARPGDDPFGRGRAGGTYITFDYFHVLPALDVSPFIAASYGIAGRSSVDAEMVGGTGDVTTGVRATYRSVWHVEVRVTDYIGSAGSQPLADRNFFAFNVRRTF